jgi:DNA polymerase III epsilon subunit-like protein
MITSAWIDTETTGIDPRDSAPFEVALLLYKGPECVLEKLYRLNPLNDEIKFGEEAYKIHGVAEETIRSYPPFGEVVPEIIADLKEHLPPEKYVMGGYLCAFDYGQVGGLFFRAGYQISDYFSGRFIDVYELVKRAAEKGFLPKTPDQKLATMTKALGISHEAAHTAMDDIKATRKLYEAIYRIQKGGKSE